MPTSRTWPAFACRASFGMRAYWTSTTVRQFPHFAHGAAWAIGHTLVRGTLTNQATVGAAHTLGEISTFRAQFTLLCPAATTELSSLHEALVRSSVANSVIYCNSYCFFEAFLCCSMKQTGFWLLGFFAQRTVASGHVSLLPSASSSGSRCSLSVS